MGTAAGEMRQTEVVSADESEDRTEEIREDIEQTRSEMSQTIDELQDKLSPQHLKAQVKDTVREATIGRAEHMVSNAGETARGAGHSVMETIKENPVPAAMVGIGLGWLFMNNSNKASAVKYQARSKAGEIAGNVQETAGEVAGRAQERVEQVSSQAQDQAHQAVDQSRQMLEESPLIAGALAVALGAAVGLALPETRRENELMGETRDKMLGQAREVAQDTMEKVEHVATEATHAAKETAKEEAHKQGLTPSQN